MGYLDIQFDNSIKFDIVWQALKRMHYKISSPGKEYVENDENVAKYLVEICKEWMENERKIFNV